ncbi:MAG: S9 family peptidase [Acidiferrobacterales bacterium]|nr:S9 family peptidase [Acidiferrobacterales bacterium]
MLIIKYSRLVSFVVIGYLFSTSLFAEVELRTLNDGNLVLENIPDIPKSVVDDLNRFQNIRSAPVRDWTRDSQSLYISTRFGDVSQLHRVDKPGGTRSQLTFFDEPIGSISRQPNGDLLSFTMDAGGSENAQVFILDPATGESTMLSDGESRNGQISWRRDGAAIAYQSTRRNGSSNDLWLTDIDNPTESSLIMESPDGSWWAPRDWSSNGSKLLVQQYVSVTNSSIFVLDLITGKLERIRGSESSPTVNYVVAFDKDDEGIYFLTDEGDQFAKLAYQKIGETNFEILTTNIPWAVESVRLNEDRTQMAFSVNEGGLSQLYLMDVGSGDYQQVRGLPVGRVTGFNFSPNGKRLALTLNTAKTPSDSFVLDLLEDKQKHGQLVRWTFSEVGGLDTEQFIEPELIAYPTFDKDGDDQRTIPAFVYKPKNIEKSAPVIISIHGGPESQYRPSFSSRIQLWVEKLGAVVIAPNVRGSSGYGKDYVALDNGFKREDSVKDIGALLDWIAKQPDMDKDRIIVFGGSYGGYMVLASAVHFGDRLVGAIDIVGISNFVTFLKNTKDYRRDLRRVEYGDERDPEMLAFLEAISPNNHVNKIKIPLFVVQGENDPRVPVSEAIQIVEALRQAGNEVWYMNALNEGHGYSKKENRDVYQQVTMMFMAEHFGLE